MSQLDGTVENMLRNSGVLQDGWKQFFDIWDEYVPTLLENPGRLVEFLVEDCCRCPSALIQASIELLEKGKNADLHEYRKVAAAIARQPVDRSAIYLNIAGLDMAAPLTDDDRLSLAKRVPDNYLSSYGLGDETAQMRFATCLALIYREVNDAPREYPMSPYTAQRLAAAVFPLIEWNRMYPESRIPEWETWGSIYYYVGTVPNKIPIVRPLTCGFAVIKQWVVLAGDVIDPKAREYMGWYADLLVACCSIETAPLELIIMNALLVLMGRFPDESVPDYLSYPPCDLSEVPAKPRATSVPACAVNIERGGGSLAEFEEFMEHIRVCEEQTSDGIKAAFKEEACRVYLSLPPEISRKRSAIIKHKLQTM